MSVSNYDRHGIENLMHEPVKPLDRLKIPPFALYFWILSMIAYVAVKVRDLEELDI